MAGLLKIIATPIGNLTDMSPRGILALKDSQVILAENITHSRKLFNAIGLDLSQTKLISCSPSEEAKRIPTILERLEHGEVVGLVSDAGAPTVSDPGGRLISAVIEAGYKIEVIPGPSAIITALMGAGLIANRFAFLGFLPKKGKERVRLIQTSYTAGLALVIFESPNRISETIENLFEICGPQKVVVARELTKHFETFHRGILGQDLKPEIVTKGELVIIIEAKTESAEINIPNDAFEKPAMGNKAAAKQLSAQYGISVKEAYQRLLTNAK
ncbi:MAG: 16S rRNA (cytidine(1402)-2'-O)-methyltransferase [Myxococcaceae bacterium]